MDWIKPSPDHSNVICEIDDTSYVSYNPSTFNEYSIFTELGNMLGGDYKDGEETALYDGKTWRILEGDFRKEYEEAIPHGFEACIKVFEAHQENRSNWSSDKETK